MTAMVPWTVVSHAADDSVPAGSVARLMAWLDGQPDVEMHSVLWASGHNGTGPYDFGRFADVGRAHEVLPARVLRAVGLAKVGGGLAGRAVRAAVRGLPRQGVLYLSSARAGAVLRYLPPGDRTVVTHLHVMDRREEPPLPPERVDALRSATDIWLAVDEETRDWAVGEWGIEPDAIHVLPDVVDPASVARAVRVTDPNVLRLALRGSTWFRRDHAPRVLHHIVKQRPDLSIELVWAEAVDRKHLGPLLHDLRQLDLVDRLEVPSSSDDLRRALKEVDVLAFTTPDDDMGWLLPEAGAAGIPMVCFDTHRSALGVEAAGGAVVPYLEVAQMAGAVLELLDDQRSPRDAGVADERAELSRRDVGVVGPRLREIVGTGGAR